MNTSDLIFIIEDNEDDIFFMKRALKQANITAPLHVANDGMQAISYLNGDGIYNDRTLYPVPNLIFLDLKLPYKDGFEILSWIRSHPNYDNTKVIILSSSDEARDQEMAFSLGASAYITKPAQPDLLKSFLFDSAQGPINEHFSLSEKI